MVRACSVVVAGLAMSVAGACWGQLSGPATQSPLAPTPLPGLRDEGPMFPNAALDAAIPSPESILGFPVGERAATHAQIEACFKAWDGAGAGGARAKLFEHGQTWEGRTLYHMAIGSPENLARLDEVRAGVAKLADPRDLDGAERDRLLGSLPAIAWLSYSIHGDETSGADAALAVAHRLIAGTDEETMSILRDVVVIVDPMMNPDGRDRFLKMLAEHRAAHPNVDDQSLLHSGYWPWGRTNHYMFDLNRDWIFGVHPETRGRIRAVRQWNPQLFLDAHEMFSQDTFLFSPPRAPFNPFHPASRLDSMRTLSKGIAKDFDALGWRYYTGEWNEGWYPGYSDAWAAFGGAVGVLFEQARIAEDGVRRREGTIEPYRLSVRKQAVASIALLKTLRDNKDAMLRAFADERSAALDNLDGPAAWALRSSDSGRLRALVDTLRLQGVEVERAAEGFRASGTDRFGREVDNAEFTGETYIVRRAQPNAALAAALLELDPRMGAEFLQEERRELLRMGQSRLYDTTAWNLGMMYDVDVTALADAPTVDTEGPGDELRAAPTLDRSSIGWATDGAGDATLALAARLMERGVWVRINNKPFPLGGAPAPRGTLLVLRVDNTLTGGALEDVMQEECRATGVSMSPLATGMGEHDEPDLGGEHFPLLERPRIALLSRAMLDNYSVGESWHAIDQRLGVRATLLDADTVGYSDLRRYNVLVVPDSWGDSPVSTMGEDLVRWVREGGTLIAIGGSAAAAAHDPGEDGSNDLSDVRLLPDVLDELADYERQVLREWAGRMETIDEESVESFWASEAPEAIAFPWEGVEELPDSDELEKRDAWQAMFMPQGAFVAARTDDRHWLTCGVAPEMSLLTMGDNVLMAGESVNAPVRIGVLEAALAPDPVPVDDEDDEDGEAPERVRRGWSAVPEGHTLRVRLSGLLWPEASARLANSAYVTQESLGAGQVILFASSPTFRGAAVGSTRLFLNAVVYGPGCGADGVVVP